MDINQVVFIICTDNMLYYDECVRYIKDLRVPDGYSIDIICIQEARSIAEAYNAGMQASDAKYKIYLHQDTFILNRDFIFDILKVFSNDTVGMIGVIGGDIEMEYLSENACRYKTWGVGTALIYNGSYIIDGNMEQKKGGDYVKVKAIDGLLMATQYDIPWREDIIDGWDFYNISQSIEMTRRGYHIVVPYQDEPWCYHDCGAPKLDYDKGCLKQMKKEYLEIQKKEKSDISEKHRQEQIQLSKDLKKILIDRLEKGEYAQLQELADEVRENQIRDTQVREIANLMEIYLLEKNSLDKRHSEWFYLRDWEQIYEYYNQVRFTLLRAEYRREDERIEWLKGKIRDGKVTKDAIRQIASFTLKKWELSYKTLLEKQDRQTPLVSVVVEVYNQAKLIGKTLESILQQTYQNLEVIVIDDASTDGSQTIISSYQDPRIKTIFLEKNRNVCNAGNIAFKKASGKYLAIIGHDDIWKKDKIEKQVDFLEEHPLYGACFTWVDFIDEDGVISNEKWEDLYSNLCKKNFAREVWLKKLIQKGNCFCAPSACIRLEYLREVGYYRYGLVQLQDYDLWMRLLTKASFYVIQEKLTLYRRFNEPGRNISSISLATINRDNHEKQWILDTLFRQLSSKEFIQVFKNDRIRPQACTEEEILCEKAFMLWKMGNCFAEKWFLDILEEEKIRKILEEKYHFELNDFYKMNTKPMFFDSTSLMMAKKAKV